MRLKSKRDKNEPDIVKALRDKGYSVRLISDGGVPDLVIGFTDNKNREHNIFIEVKGKNGKLTSTQKEWLVGWNGQHNIARTVEEAISIMDKIISLFNEETYYGHSFTIGNRLLDKNGEFVVGYDGVHLVAAETHSSGIISIHACEITDDIFDEFKSGEIYLEEAFNKSPAGYIITAEHHPESSLPVYIVTGVKEVDRSTMPILNMKWSDV